MSRHVGSDFAGFDSDRHLYFLWFRVVPKLVLVAAYSGYRARAAACVHLRCERDEMEFEHAQGETVIPKGTVFIFADETGKYTTFETTRDTNCERLRRFEDVREWIGVVRQGGREEYRVAGGMQDNGEEVVYSPSRYSKKESSTRVESQKTLNGSNRVRKR